MKKTKSQLNLKKELQKLVNSSAVANILDYGKDSQKDAKLDLENRFFVEYALSKILVGVTSWFSMALHLSRGKKTVYPKNWLHNEGRVNANIIMSCLLCQLSNYGLSVIEIVEKGMDTPARALLRSTSDLCYLISVLSADRETFSEYVITSNEPAKDTWYRLFRNKRISQKLRQIESKLNVDKNIIDQFNSYRIDNNEFFSEAIHHSYNAMIIGSLPTKHGSETVELALLGGSTSASKKTLSYMIISFVYVLTILLSSDKIYNEIQFSNANTDYWLSGEELFNNIKPLFINWMAGNVSMQG